MFRRSRIKELEKDVEMLKEAVCELTRHSRIKISSHGCTVSETPLDEVVQLIMKKLGVRIKVHHSYSETTLEDEPVILYKNDEKV